jgi:hypothetical protein
MRDELEEFIKATQNVSTIQEAKGLLRDLKNVCEMGHEYVTTDIAENIDQSKIVEAALSDDPKKEVFTEISAAFVDSINEYLKGKREEYGDE